MTITLFGGLPLPKKIKRLLSKFGANAHMYLPGVSPSQGFIPGNYIDSAGTQPAVYDQPVGLVLDAAGSVGAELAANGDFSQGTAGWNLGAGYSISSGKLIATSSSSNGDYAFTYSSGKTYRVAYTIDSITGSVSVNLGGALGTVRNGIGTYSELITTVDALSFVRVQSRFGTASFVVDNISVREVTGIHANQATPGYKPIERRGIVNLARRSSDRTSGDYFGNGFTVNSATSITFAAGGGYHVGQTLTSVGSAYTHAVELSGTEGDVVNIYVQDNAGAYQTTSIAVTLTAAPAIYTVTRVVGEGSALFGVSGFGKTVTVGATGFFAGTLTAAQILAAGGIPLTTTAPASSSAGNAYLEFDGVDDLLSLPGPLFQQADDHCVIVAASPALTDDTYRRIFTQENGSSTAAEMEFTNFGVNVTWRDDAPNAVSLVGPIPSVGVPFVFSARKTGNTRIGRFNGVTFGTNTSVLGATRLNPTAYFGNRAANDRQMKGKLFPAIVIKGTVSDADLLVLEKFVAQLSGVTL